MSPNWIGHRFFAAIIQRILIAITVGVAAYESCHEPRLISCATSRARMRSTLSRRTQRLDTARPPSCRISFQEEGEKTSNSAMRCISSFMPASMGNVVKLFLKLVRP